jgi:hypothetical protein
MNRLICAATLLLLSVPALAGEENTLDPNAITLENRRPQLQLNDHQRGAIQNALETENTEQKTPPKFEAKIGEPVPLTLTVDVMPESLVQQEPSLKQYGYAKLAKDVLVIDPLKKTIVAVLPRQSPSSGKDVAPGDWAATRGRELTGQAPVSNDQGPAPEAAGDSGDKKNGTEVTPKGE